MDTRDAVAHLAGTVGTLSNAIGKFSDSFSDSIVSLAKARDRQQAQIDLLQTAVEHLTDRLNGVEK